ncbi:MAG: hypothetical protein AB8B63_05410 [Granulosicoccus sp.]
MDWTEWVVYCAVSGISLLVGYLLGVRQARAIKKRVMLHYNSQSLELLEANNKLNQLGDYAQTQSRRERLLSLTLDKLHDSNQQVRKMELQKEALNRRAFVKMSRLRLRAVQAEEKAGRYKKMARKAYNRLQRLQELAPAAAVNKSRQRRSMSPRSGPHTVQNPVRARSRDKIAVENSVHNATGSKSATVSKLRDSTKVPAAS